MSILRYMPLLLLLWVGGVESAGAQQPTSVRVVEVSPGSRVRVRPAEAASPVVGRLLAVRGDTVVVAERRTGLEYTVPLTEGSRLEVSTGRDPERAALRGALYGGLSGAVLGGLLLGSLDPSGPGYEYFPGTRKNAILLGAVGLGVPLGLLGALIGGASGGEHWRRVDLPLRMRVTAQAGGVGLVGNVRL